MAEAPSSSGFFSAVVNGSWTATGVANADDWSFEAETGDLINARIETAVGNSQPRLQLLNTSNAVLFIFNGGADGLAVMYAFRITTPGTYRVRVFTDTLAGNYGLRVDLARGMDLEIEPNDTVGSATRITPKTGTGAFTFGLGGITHGTDTVGDFVALGLAPAAAQLATTVQVPASTLTAGELSLRLYEQRLADRGLDFASAHLAAIPHHAVFDGIETSRALTLEAWVLIESYPSSWFPIFEKYEATGDNGWSLLVQNGGGGISFYSANGTGVSASVTPTSNVWHHIAVTYDHAANEVRFYLDGALIATRTSPGVLFNTDGEPAYIGHSAAAGEEYADGVISEVRLWNRALTTAEVQANFAATDLAGSETNLVGLWRLDEGIGTNAADSSATGNAATLGGGDPARVPAWTGGAIRPQTLVAGTSLNRTFSSATNAWLQIAAAANRGLSARYYLSGSLTDATSLQVASLSFPSEGGSTTDFIQSFAVTFNDELDAAAANNTANLDLRAAGADTLFNTADDDVYPLVTPTYTSGTTLNLALASGPLQPGSYRLTIGLGMRDRSGNPLGASFTRNFTVAQLGGYRIESRSNETLATATPLVVVTDGTGGLALGRGNSSTTTDLDFFTFSANTGDRVFVGSQNVEHVAATGRYFRIYRPEGAQVVEFGSYYGTGQTQFIAPSTGTYAVRVEHYYTSTVEYRFSVAVLPGTFALEVESNDSVGAANVLTWTPVTGSQSAAVAGYVRDEDPADVYALGFLAEGTQVALTASRPPSSTLVWLLDVLNASSVVVASEVAGAATLNFTIPAGQSGTFFARIRASTGADLFAQYRLGLTLTDGQAPTITTDTLPAEGATVTNFFGHFGLTFSEILQAATVNNAANYDLRAAGPDGNFDTGDDELYSVALVTAYTTGLGANYFVSDGPTQPGTYRFQAKTGFLDLYANPLAAVYTRSFTIAGVAPYVFESRSNGTAATATALAPTADGAGFLGLGRGTINTTADQDFFSFNATIGDRVIVGSMTPGNPAATGRYFRMYRADGVTQVTEFGSYDGTGQGVFIAPATGVYFVRVENYYTSTTEYRFAVSVQPGSYELESEDNGSAGAADVLSITQTVGSLTAEVGGAVRFGDVGDWYALGFLAEGTQVTLGATNPPSSNLVWLLDVLNASSVVVGSGTAGATPLNFTVPAGQSGTFFARLRASGGADLFGLYRLTIALADTQAPTITGDTLPAQGATVSDFYDRFTLNFSENLQASTVNNLANYDLRAAGTDGLFDTGDDQLYTVTLTAVYTTGQSASYFVTDGPAQPGLYRFQAKTGLSDLYLNPMPAVFTRTFTVVGVPPYVFETRTNDSFATALSLASGGEGAGFSGSWRDGVNIAAGGNAPQGIATADFNNDGKLDLVCANYDAGTISVLLGDGTGGFAAATTYAAPNNPFKVVVGDFNGDSRPDVAVTRTAGAAVSVFLNLAQASGALAAGVNYTTGVNPQWLVARDLNGDTRLDLATANLTGNSVSVFYGNADGTFAAAVNTAVTGGPFAIAAGDVDSDGRIDLVVGTSTDDSVKVLNRLDTGAYAAGSVFAWTGGISSVAIGDVNGDGRADMLAMQDSGTQIRRWHQDASHVLIEGDPLTFPSTNGYSLLLSDYDADGDVDVIAGRNSVVAVFENAGGGVFGSSHNLAVGGFARQVVTGDFNADGRPDLATTVQQSHQLRVFLGRGPEALPTDGTGALGLGRGTIATGPDQDFFSFSARAGERVIVSSEIPSHAAATGQYFRIYRPDGAQVTEFGSYYGSAQGQFVAPVSGVYFVRVERYYGYTDEYHFAVAVFPGNFELEHEGNDSSGVANSFPFVQAVGTQSVSLAGVFVFGDVGDWTALGNLATGTQITLAATKPPSSNLVWILDVMNSASVAVASSAAGAASLTYTIPAGQAGTYYTRVRASTGADLFAQYRLSITLADNQPPTITDDTLPEEGASITALFDRFTLNFSEDMQASTVNDLASYDLRAAGTDGVFDSGDDLVVPLVLTASYSSGLATTMRTANGATLPVGLYRFQARAGLRDLYANALAPVFTRTFTVSQIAGYAYDTELNGTLATATPLVIASSQPDLFGAGGRGYLLTGSDVDFWSFDLLAGDRVTIIGDIPGNPGGSGLSYQLFNPAGTMVQDVVADYYGPVTIPLFTATAGGTYKLRIGAYYGYTGEHRFRVYVYRGGLQIESEVNDTIATANPLTLTASGNNRMGSLAGMSRLSGELDYFNLGTIDAGNTIFLSTRQPAHSTFVPVVSLYNAAGTLLAEASGGRASDPVAQVPISVTGSYYALVRTSGATGGIAAEYILDALVVPTADISFPNLQVASLTPPPASGLKSGDATTLSFRVDNLGNLATPAATWIDRVVLSIDQLYGNADDLELAVLPHNGPLGAAAFYTVSSTPVTIPDGISGSFHVIVRTDHTNTVNEFVLEGDNETVTDTPIAITLADYPDLRIENLAVSEPDNAGVRTATWTLANRGTGAAAAGFDERFLVRNTTSGATLVNDVRALGAVLAPNGTLARSSTFTAANAGNYSVEITADALSERFELNASGHTAAENNNVTSVAFSVVQLWTIAVSAEPVAGGTPSGGGIFSQGASRTVSVAINAPYIFLGWFEGGFLRSTNASYTFSLLSDRNLVARFAAPSFVITTPVAPPGSGVVSGGGAFPTGAAVDLTATAQPGYSFVNWTEGVTVLGTNATLSFTVAGNRTITANFAENNPTHVVTTATLPVGVTTVTGAGTFNNGQSTTITASASFVASDTQYTFQRFSLNGAPAGTAPSFTKTFTTLDPPALAYVAEYATQSLKPVIAQVTANLGSPVPVTTNFRLTIRFDRAMDPSIKPLVELLSTDAQAIPVVSANGTWSSVDTYAVPAVTFGATNGGTYTVRVSAAKDTLAHTMDPAVVYPFTVDVLAPGLPTLALGSTTATGVPVTWNDYSPPGDLASFRVYRSTATFTTLDGLSPIASLPASARTTTFGLLDLDTDYFVAVVPVDVAGNAATTVAPLTIRFASTIPAAVVFAVTAPTTNVAHLTWTFDPAPERGFQGFRVYRAASAFSSITGLTPIVELGAAVRSFDDVGLDRAVPHHYAVVGYNRLNQSLTAVTSKLWTDPVAGTLTTDFTANEPLLIISQSITITNGATFTVPPGTTVAFGPGAGITVQSGRLVADGTLFAPIVFTSLADIEDRATTAGDWEGITLSDATRVSTVRHTWIKFGKGLAITAGTPVVDVLGAAWNAVGGLRLSGAVPLTTQSAYLANNAVGASIEGGASLTLTGSVLKNNTVSASAAGAGTLNAAGNWWGTADTTAIAAQLSGPVNASSPLASEPILTRGLRSVDGATSTGVANLPMLFASLNATGYRISEDSSFSGVLFVDVPRDPLSSELFNTAPWQTVVPLSAGGGSKILYAQFRSPTGAVSPTVSFTTTYITSGPVIGAFSLTDGQTISRPINVTGSATSALGLASLAFAVNGVDVASSTTSPLSTRWDIRSLAPGNHSVRLAATDVAANLATRTVNVMVSPVAPPKPVITAPANGAELTVNQVTVTGTAEPLISVRIYRNGSVVATVAADAAGAFSAANLACVEGTNEFVATAFDNLGSAASTAVFISVDSGPPAPAQLLPVVYNPGAGLFVRWTLPTAGEVPIAFRVFWHSAPFTTIAQATGQTALTLDTTMTLSTVPDGLRYFAVAGYDDAGNVSALSNVVSLVVDMTLPAFAIAFDRTMPVGPGTLGMTVTASEALQGTPLLLMQPAGAGLVAVTLTAAGGNNFTANFPVTTLSARHGGAGMIVTGTDLAGNRFTGALSGQPLVFDLAKPTGALTTSVADPVSTASDVNVGVNLVLSEPPKPGTTPTLSFSPPAGAGIPLTLSGSGVNWSGQITLTSAMGDGNGTFLLNVQDAVSNVGTVLTSGEHLELYAGATPAAPAVPGGITVLPLKGGFIRVTWNAADKAQSYRLYREAGAGPAVPTTLVTAAITGLSIDDLPPADGAYRYVVTAYRLGAESGPSGVRAATSDRTPPSAPTATTAVLGASGINVGWTPGSGEAAAQWVLYRNGAAVRTVNDPAATSATDSPPRGIMNYAVAAADALGNEALGPTASIELLVGAITNLRAVVDPEIGTDLTWSSTDATATGYNVYRNGAKQNATPIPQLTFADTFEAGGLPVIYGITAVNAGGQESAPRTVVVQPLTAVINQNPGTAGDENSVAHYFDTYHLALTSGAAASAPIQFFNGEIIRAVEGETPVQVTFALPSSLAAGANAAVDVVVPAPSLPGVPQGTAFTLTTVPDAGGSTVLYRLVNDFPEGVASGVMITVSADTPPLAGALNNFTVRVFNRGHAPADFVLSRAGNTQPGDLRMLVVTADGVLAGTTPFQGTVSGVTINPAGDAFLRLAPGASADIPVTGVLVPEALGTQSVFFRARFDVIYNAVGSALQRVAGPLEGSMVSSLRVTPYYGTATTDQPAYADNQPIIISGQAISRDTGLPVPNVPLRVGIRVQSAVLYRDVTTDGSGNYQLDYSPSLGLAGEMVIWAAHPDIVDLLDQVRVRFYRMFAKPGRSEVVMSKNDYVDFGLSLLNLGDLPLTNTSLTFRAFRMESGVETAIAGLTGTARTTPPASIAGHAEGPLALRLQADANVPDDALFEFTFTTAQGASTKFTGTISFRPALAVLTTVSPAVGYAEAGVPRGEIKSVDVTVENRGLRAFTGVKLVPPAGVPWMQVNLPPDASGNILLPDVPIGGSRRFTVVFAPPDNTAVGFYDDFLLIQGANSVGDYRLNLFATVTSAETGAVQFVATNSLSDPVPNTSIWLRNSTLGTELGPLLTDVTGRVLVPDLMEGNWQWKTAAAGHGGTSGVVSIVPDQTVGVETELTLSLVTVKFSIVPVPFTDYYEIKIEQTFQTRTPVPNLILSPPHQTLTVDAGWSGTLLYTLRNEGLRSAFDVQFAGGDMPTMRVTPLITYIPELFAQETVEIPVFFEYFGPDAALSAQSVGAGATARSLAQGSSRDRAMAAAVAAPPGGGVPPRDRPTANGGLGDIYDCYKTFKYGTVTLSAWGGVSSLSGRNYTIGVNATIDVDQLLALICDGECPPPPIGGLLGSIVQKACDKIAGKIIEKVGEATKVPDLVCKAANVIKAIGCAAINLPSAPPQQISYTNGWVPGGGTYTAVRPPPISGSGWGLYGAGCFVAGTPITLGDGSTRPVEQLVKGGLLRTQLSGRTDTIAEVMCVSSEHVRELSFRPRDGGAGPDADVRTLRLTHDHRVWVDGTGWMFAVDVPTGAWLHGEDGRFYEVVGNARLPGRFDVYGVHMDGDNVFYAGGILAEDQCFQASPNFRVSPQREVRP